MCYRRCIDDLFHAIDVSKNRLDELAIQSAFTPPNRCELRMPHRRHRVCGRALKAKTELFSVIGRGDSRSKWNCEHFHSVRTVLMRSSRSCNPRSTSSQSGGSEKNIGRIAA